jgi:hypothetical protein
MVLVVLSWIGGLSKTTRYVRNDTSLFEIYFNCLLWGSILTKGEPLSIKKGRMVSTYPLRIDSEIGTL